MRTIGRFADVVIDSALPLPELIPPADADAARPRLVVDVHQDHDEVDWFHEWRLADGSVWAAFGDTGRRYRVRFPDLCDFTVSRDGWVVHAWPAPGVPEFTQRHLLLNQVVPLALSLTGRTVLHAGAVAWDHRAVVVIGPSGSGKSTLVAACARAGAAIMADDSVVIARDDTGWQAAPSYPAVRLWPSAFTHLGLSGPQGLEAHLPVAHYLDKRRVGAGQAGWIGQLDPLPISLIVVLADSTAPARPITIEALSQVFRMDLRNRAESIHVFDQVTRLFLDVRHHRVAGQPESRQADDLARVVRDMA